MKHDFYCFKLLIYKYENANINYKILNCIYNCCVIQIFVLPL